MRAASLSVSSTRRIPFITNHAPFVSRTGSGMRAAAEKNLQLCTEQKCTWTAGSLRPWLTRLGSCVVASSMMEYGNSHVRHCGLCREKHHRVETPRGRMGGWEDGEPQPIPLQNEPIV